MKRLNSLAGWLMGILVLFSALAAQAYQNPARGIENIGDPSVFKHGGVYYVYGTTGLDSVGNNLGVACWSSTDLMNWQPRGWAFLVTNSTWSQYNLISPEVHFRNGKFILLFAAMNKPEGPTRICLAESSHPAGPFVEVKAPLFASGEANWDVDPHVFRDTDGRSYMYYSTILPTDKAPIYVQAISEDLRTLSGVPKLAVGGPFQPWEINSAGRPVAEGAFVIKRNGIYYLTYSGSGYYNADYAVGYATSTSPMGPFTRYANNPILKSDLSYSPGVSGPGSGHIIPSPDGTELFYLYHAHTDAAKGGGNRSVYIDRVLFSPSGVLQIAGPTRTCQPDPSTGGANSVPPTTCPGGYTGSGTDPITTDTGWVKFESQKEGFAWSGFDPVNSAIVAHVAADANLVRRTGVFSDQSAWLPSSRIGPDRYVRAKFALYRARQQDPNDPNQVPNFRIRAANRFAHSSVLEVYHHIVSDKTANRALHETMPSADPRRPSVYTVDYDPIDVPALNTPGEGVMRAFEAYSIEPQENGELALAESSIGTYPAAALPNSNTTDVLKKVYAPGLNDAGNLRSMQPGVDQRSLVYVQQVFEGYPHLEDSTDTTPPLYFEAGLNSTTHAPGVTLDTSNIPANRVGVSVREFFPGADPTAPDYVRIEPGRQYKIRWHLTSTRAANRQPMIRLRARTLKWGWNHKVEIGGSFSAGATNNLIAQQSLPGVGTRNPDQRVPGENGGWYTTLFHVPLDPAIRPEFAADTPLSVRMPILSSQPGPGVNAYSLLDLKFGMDVIDTLSVAGGFEQEQGQVTLDRIEVRSYPRVADTE